METGQWTVESLARYLWERATCSDCKNCRVKAACAPMSQFPCEDLRDILVALGMAASKD